MTSETWKKYPKMPVHKLVRKPNCLGVIVITTCWIFLYFYVIAQLFDGIIQFTQGWNTAQAIKGFLVGKKHSNALALDAISAPTEETHILYGSFYYFFLCGIAGIISCGITHTSIVPLDLTKCRMQVYPEKYFGIIHGFRRIIDDDGITGLTKGWVSTAIGYSLQGFGKFGFYEVFKAFYSGIFQPDLVYEWRTVLYLCAAATAEFFADIMLVPLEAIKVRMQTSHNAPINFHSCVFFIWRTEGIHGFYKGLVPLWLRQIPYTMMKFTCFERTIELLYLFVVPRTRSECTKEEQLVVTFVAGYIAGIFCAIVSHPADTIISKLNQDSGLSVPVVVKYLGFSGLWKGLFPRILMIGTLTALQWFIYDSMKTVFHLPRQVNLGYAKTS